MSNIFDDLKKFAVSDILSVSGKDKTTKVIEEHMNVLVEVALIKGEQSKQAEVDDLRKKIDEHNQKLNTFIDELKKTHNDDKNNRIDYCRGFLECADSSVQVFLRDVGFID